MVIRNKFLIQIETVWLSFIVILMGASDEFISFLFCPICSHVHGRHWEQLGSVGITCIIRERNLLAGSVVLLYGWMSRWISLIYIFLTYTTIYEKWIFFPYQEFPLLVIMEISSYFHKYVITGISFVLTLIHSSHCLLGHGHAKLEQSWTEDSSWSLRMCG